MKQHRYNLHIPVDLFADLKETAKNRGITLIELLRKFIRLGLLISKKMESNPEAIFILRESDKETEIVIL